LVASLNRRLDKIVGYDIINVYIRPDGFFKLGVKIMFAVISHNKNQYRVEVGKEYKIDFPTDKTDEKKIKFEEVLLVDNDKEVKVGTPTVAGASVEADFLGFVRGEKVEGIKFKAKKRYMRTLGHKQTYGLIKITSINA
jgi:large subunit ribosomal protein L21